MLRRVYIPVFFIRINLQNTFSMKGIKLSERIRYMHCEGEEGTHGILVLLGTDRYPTKAVEIETQADFRRFYDNFRVTEVVQTELLSPLAVA